MSILTDEIEDKYEEPCVERKIIGNSGLDPDRKTVRSDVEEIISERLNMITTIVAGGE